MPDQLTQTFLSNLANVEKELPILALVDYDVPSPVSVVLCLHNFFVEGVRSGALILANYAMGSMKTQRTGCCFRFRMYL